jgi:hypothetical protein
LMEARVSSTSTEGMPRSMCRAYRGLYVQCCHNHTNVDYMFRSAQTVRRLKQKLSQ